LNKHKTYHVLIKVNKCCYEEIFVLSFKYILANGGAVKVGTHTAKNLSGY